MLLPLRNLVVNQQQQLLVFARQQLLLLLVAAVLLKTHFYSVWHKLDGLLRGVLRLGGGNRCLIHGRERNALLLAHRAACGQMH